MFIDILNNLLEIVKSVGTTKHIIVIYYRCNEIGKIILCMNTKLYFINDDGAIFNRYFALSFVCYESQFKNEILIT